MVNNEQEAGNYDLGRVNRALARLYFGRRLEGGLNWLNDLNRDSIYRTVHYGDDLSVSGSPLTLGGLIDNNPGYIADACARILTTGKTVTREEFLASFLELLLTADESRMLELSRATGKLDDESAKIFDRMTRTYLVACQIPVDDLFTAVGIYVLQKAQDQGIISNN